MIKTFKYGFLFKSLAVLVAVVGLSVTAAGTDVELNSTTLDGSETASAGNATGVHNLAEGGNFDAIKGRTWKTNANGPTGGPGTEPLFTELVLGNGVPVPSQVQAIHAGAAFEPDAAGGGFQFNFGNDGNASIAMAQAFSLTNVDDFAPLPVEVSQAVAIPERSSLTFLGVAALGMAGCRRKWAV